MLTRRLATLVPLVLAACGDDGPPRTFTPLRYDYLTPLRLNVATIDYADLPPPGPLDALSPAPAGPALLQMAQDRLGVGGSSGRALVTIEEARITRAGESLDGAMALHLDIVSADGTRAGYAEARVARHRSGGGNLRTQLYDMTKQMLDDMNVELEYQIRRSLRDYVQVATPVDPPAPVQRQDLGPPAAQRTPAAPPADELSL